MPGSEVHVDGAGAAGEPGRPIGPSPRAAERCRLLLIKDTDSLDEPVVALLTAMIPMAQVEVLYDLDVAVDMLRGNDYDGVVLDLSRPDADVRDVVRAARAVHQGKPLWVVTGRYGGGVELWGLGPVEAGGPDGPDATAGSRVGRMLEAHEAPTCAVDAYGTIIATNPAWGAFMAANGGRTETCGIGANYLSACDRAATWGGEGLLAAGVAAGLRSVLTGEEDRYQCEYPCHSPTTQRWFSLRIVPAQFDGTVGAVVSHVDVTDMYQLQQTLAHQTLHDVLTGLPNRLLLADRLTQALAQAQRNGTHVCVAFIDLDDFKRINDGYGHAVGDAVLVQVAQRLSRWRRAADTVSRYSGDEFVAVFGELASATEAEALAAGLAACLVDPFDIGGESLHISASIGVAVGHVPHEAEDLLREADAAMYDAKRHGSGQIELFG